MSKIAMAFFAKYAENEEAQPAWTLLAPFESCPRVLAESSE
jgi:hypothetical protein